MNAQRAAPPQMKWPAKVNHVPREVFVRPDLFEEELRRIFYGNEWIGIAHAGELPNKGDFKTVSVGRVPLLVTRDMDAKLHVFYNACSHRANQLETAASGNKTEFQCPYHRWRFDAKGHLIHCPVKSDDEFSPGFSRARFPLAQPRMALVHGVIFVTFSEDTPPIEVKLEGFIDHLASIFGGDGRLRLIGYQKTRFKGNWKVYRDNDAYHAPLLHTAFRMLNWQGGKGRQFCSAYGHRGYVSELSPHRAEGMLLKDPSLISHRGQGSIGSASLLMFPMFSAIRHMDVINIRFLNPIGVDETDLTFAYFRREDDDEEMVRHRIRQSSNLLGPCGMVSMEDMAVFHRVQIGSHTPGPAVFQKGVKDEYRLTQDMGQNDETSNLHGWEYYRQVMGFEREPA